jgi:hypothetical protein
MDEAPVIPEGTKICSGGSMSRLVAVRRTAATQEAYDTSLPR